MQRDIELLYEMGGLRFIDRTWKQFQNPDVANVTEHTFRVMWIALTLAKMEKADLNKVLTLALVHDVAESRTGDVNYISRQYTQRNETQAVADIFVDTLLGAEFIAAAHEAEAKESLEAQIVKDADTLDVQFELNEQISRGHAIGPHLHEVRKEPIYDRLYTKSVKKLWKQIDSISPHSWHLNARNNRFQSGDWQNKPTK